MNDSTLQAINELIEAHLIPSSGNFTISEDLIFSFREAYVSRTGRSWLNPLAGRRFAGCSLVNLKLRRKIKPKFFEEGFVYLIKNPVWPNHTKIGITTNLDRRLSAYQTADPTRSYYVNGYEFVLDRKNVERDVLQKFSLDLRTSEWVKDRSSDEIIEFIRKDLPYREIARTILDSKGKILKEKDVVAFQTKHGKATGTIVKISPKTLLIKAYIKGQNKIKMMNEFPSSVRLIHSPFATER